MGMSALSLRNMRKGALPSTGEVRLARDLIAPQARPLDELLRGCRVSNALLWRSGPLAFPLVAGLAQPFHRVLHAGDAANDVVECACRCRFLDEMPIRLETVEP